MKIKNIILIVSLTLGLVTLMSSTCNTTDDATPDCAGPASATATGEIDQTFCFTNVTIDYYDPENRISVWGRTDNNVYGFDMSVSVTDGQTITTGTYNCGSDNPAFVELIMEDPSGDSEFYKSQSGTVTITEASQTTFKATFDVTAVGYYNGKSIHFTGTINK